MPTIKKNKEVWKDIKGYEGYYQVSNLGRVRSLDRTVRVCGGGIRKVKGRLLIPQLSGRGYFAVALWKNNKEKSATVHRLVINSFVPKTEGKEGVNHRDGNKQNNYLENLERCSQSENCSHAYRIGLRSPARSREISIRCARTGQRFRSMREATRKLGIGIATVSKSINKKKAVCGKYKFERI